MDLQREQEPFKVELKFARSEIVKEETTNKTFTVFLGLPKDTYVKEGGFFFPPTKPHFFTADNFQLQRDGEALVDEHNVQVLFMHGIIKDGKWVTLDGLTLVEDLVKAYENSIGNRVDALFVCNPKNTTRVRVVPFSGNYEKPRIFMKKGYAHGEVSFNQKTGETNVTMQVDEGDEIEFEKWKAGRRVKIIR